ncbi:MAG: ribonuclease III [Pseudomonadota bacterium]
MDSPDIKKLMQRLRYTFDNEELLLQALTHSSWANEHPGTRHNETLEFIGDAVLGFLVCCELFRRFPEHDEGDLTAAKSHLVGKDNLHDIAGAIDICSFLRLGEGERKSGGEYPQSMGVNTFEALLGAVFLDGGIDEAKKVLMHVMSHQIDMMRAEGIPQDPKSLLQALSLERFGKLPVYKVETETGPDHAKEFLLNVAVPDGRSATGRGPSKKEAQKDAARNLLKLLEG